LLPFCFRFIFGYFLLSCCYYIVFVSIWFLNPYKVVKVMFLQNMLSILCSPFVDNFGFLILFWVQFYVFVFLILWCIFFLVLSSYLCNRSIQILTHHFYYVFCKFLILFFIHVRFPLCSWKRANCFDLLQFICLLEISEILDLSSSKCYKKVEKRSTSKFQVQKNDKWNMINV